jgi:Ca-activated chloride channel family protein
MATGTIIFSQPDAGFFQNGIALMQLIADFHFLRPLWLAGLLASGVLLLVLWRQQRAGRGWRGVISEQLLPHLLVGNTQQHFNPLVYIGLAWFVASIALAGPSWEKVPQPVEASVDSMVVLYDLSLSMLAEDVKPSRLIRSRQKLLDLLTARKDGNTALVAYAGDAHIVSPLTDDDRTIANLLPALHPEMMPVPGSNPQLAVAQAIELLENAGMSQGQIVLLTDSVTTLQTERISSTLGGTPYTLSVIGVGTSDGGAIPQPEGLLRDGSGNIVLASLDRGPLKKLAQDNGGVYSDLSLNDTDLERVLSPNMLPDFADTLHKDRTTNSWLDMGFWLIPLLIPMALACFRQGWLLCLLILLPIGQEAQALEWQDLWRTRDQQAAQLLEQGEANTAAERFTDPDWAAAANYRAGNYPAAQAHYQTRDDANAAYNNGNSLARGGDYKAAISAYESALLQQPDMEDAAFNKQLLEQLQEQEQEQEQEQQQDQEQDSDQDQDQQQQSQNADQQQDGQQSEQSSEQQEQEQAQRDADQAEQPDDQPGEAQRKDQQEEEERLANEAWLRRIPDDPSGLLRRKFQYESQKRALERSTSNETAW